MLTILDVLKPSEYENNGFRNAVCLYMDVTLVSA
jgi:hypothetical protein